MNGLKKSRLGWFFYCLGLNNRSFKRLDWEHMEPWREAGVVKGVQRRVIVVKSPDPVIFEEAIFIVREDYLKSRSGTAGDVLEEARHVAGTYVQQCTAQKKRPLLRLKMKPTFFAALGAAATGIAWFASKLVGV